jgi:hypothetical protein
MIKHTKKSDSYEDIKKSHAIWKYGQTWSTHFVTVSGKNLDRIYKVPKFGVPLANKF